MSFWGRKRSSEDKARRQVRPEHEEFKEQVQADVPAVGPAVLRDLRLAHPANVAPRAAVLRAVQQARGNVALRELMVQPAAENEETEPECGFGMVLGQSVPYGPGARTWADVARQGPLPLPAVGRSSGPVPATAQGFVLQYGQTEWKASEATFPQLQIAWTAAEGEEGKWTGQVQSTTSAMGPVSLWSLPAGEHQVPGHVVTARFPQCGESGKQVPFYTMVSDEMAGIARMAEEEHRSDYTRSYQLTLVKWAGIINSATGQTFGPDTKAAVQAEIQSTLNARGNKTRAQWVAEINRLNALSLQRDAPPGASAHTLKSDGQPVSCPDDCSKVVGTTVRAPSTQVPGVPSATLIN
jgi:hypothetical protein